MQQLSIDEARQRLAMQQLAKQKYKEQRAEHAVSLGDRGRVMMNSLKKKMTPGYSAGLNRTCQQELTQCRAQLQQHTGNPFTNLHQPASQNPSALQPFRHRLSLAHQGGTKARKSAAKKKTPQKKTRKSPRKSVRKVKKYRY